MNRSTVWRAFSPSRGLGGPVGAVREVVAGEAAQRNMSAATYGGVMDWSVEEGVVAWEGKVKS